MAAPDPEPLVRIPLIEESIAITSQVRDTGGVRVHKTIDEREESCELPHMQESLTVERIAIGHLLDSGPPPQARYEGDTLVIPVLEEVAVVQKRLRLVEEVRITRRRTEHRTQERVNLRREHVEIERIAPHHSKGESP